jgi:nucleoside-diphosphate-sugar epimerase
MADRVSEVGDYRDCPVLVTGGAGAIGSNVIVELARLGAGPIAVIDDLSGGFRWNLPDVPGLSFVEGSITDPSALAAAFAVRPRRVFHLAAQFANQRSVDDPEGDLRVSGLGTLRVLQACVEVGVERVVYASSGCALTSVEGAAGGAAAPGQLTTPYQITKLLGEHYATFFGAQHGLAVARPRLFNVYGPGEVPGRYRNVIANFCFRALRGLPLVITGTGAETRDFCWVGDAVDALLASGTATAATGHAFQVASGRETPIAALAAAVVRATGSDSPIEHAHRRDWDHKPRLLGDPTTARELLGVEPGTVSLEEGLGQTVEWMQANWARIERDADFG